MVVKVACIRIGEVQHVVSAVQPSVAATAEASRLKVACTWNAGVMCGRCPTRNLYRYPAAPPMDFGQLPSLLTPP